jgi:hypothetical protein
MVIAIMKLIDGEVAKDGSRGRTNPLGWRVVDG